MVDEEEEDADGSKNAFSRIMKDARLLEGDFTSQLEKPYLISNQITKDSELGQVSSILSREDQNLKFKLLNENLLIRNRSQDDMPYGDSNKPFNVSNKYGKSNISIKQDSQADYKNDEKLNKWLFKPEYQSKIVEVIEKRASIPETTSSVDRESATGQPAHQGTS